MSPSKTRKPTAHLRSRREIITAVVVAVAIIGGTALLIWLIRPGEPGVPGSGGLLSRQPRVTLLVVGTLAVIAFAVWWIHTRYRARRMSRRAATILTVAIIVIGAVVLGVLWPGGLVRDYPSLVQVPDVTNPTDTSPPETPTSAPPGTTAVPAPTTPPTTTAAVTTTPTTGG